MQLQDPAVYKRKEIDQAFFRLFRTHILGPAQSGQEIYKSGLYETPWKVYDMFRAGHGYENRLFIRLTRTEPLYKAQGYQSAIQKLKRSGCIPHNVQGWIPHKNSSTSFPSAL